MIRTKQLFLIFIPAILIATFVFFIRVAQYEPLYPKKTNAEQSNETSDFQIPVTAQDPVIGYKPAPRALVAFEDFGCEGCKAQDAVLTELLQKHPKQIKIVWKGLPVTRFPFDTRLAHQYAVCAHMQGKWLAFKQYAFANSENLSPSVVNTIAKTIGLDAKKLTQCLSSGAAESAVQQVEQLATTLNIQAVPTIFWNNKQINPPQSVEAWEALLHL